VVPGVHNSVYNSGLGARGCWCPSGINVDDRRWGRAADPVDKSDQRVAAETKTAGDTHLPSVTRRLKCGVGPKRSPALAYCRTTNRYGAR
jgi:hypothetical protein